MSLWFLDESGAILTPLVGKTWAPRGETPRLFHNFGCWTRINIIAAINPKGEIHVHFKPSNRRSGLKSCDVAKFLRHLLQHHEGQLVVFWDGGSQHKGAEIDALLAHNPRLRVIRLPPYAYDLNPTDAVFDHIKWHTLKNFTPRSTHELLEGLRKAAQKLRRTPRLVRAFFFNTALPREDLHNLTGHPGGL